MNQSIGGQGQYFIIKALRADPYENLAIEECLMDWVDEQSRAGERIAGLFLWQSDNTIVIGRNQNAYNECDLNVVKEHGIRIVRRTSGGGAVYQDLGNLNYTFILSKGIADKERYIRIILDALKTLGVEALASGRNDITVEGRKISGTAYREFGEVFMQHGTLLIQENLELASICLQPDLSKLEKKGIKSVRSRIANISEFAEVAVSDIEKIVEDSFADYHRNWLIIHPTVENDKRERIKEWLSSDEWIYQKEVLDGTVKTITGSWGILKYSLLIQEGVIKKFVYESDTINPELWEIVSKRIVGLLVSKIKTIADIPDGTGAIETFIDNVKALEDNENHV